MVMNVCMQNFSGVNVSLEEQETRGLTRLRIVGCDSGLCKMEGFGISDVDNSYSVT